MFKKSILSLALVGLVVLAAGKLCHSEQFWLAKDKLQKLVLNPAQKAEIARLENDFNTKWRRSHSELGCKAHEMHVDEFIASASGVLTGDQFKKFRGRTRNRVETVGYDIRLTGQHIDNLLKLAQNI